MKPLTIEQYEQIALLIAPYASKALFNRGSITHCALTGKKLNGPEEIVDYTSINFPSPTGEVDIAIAPISIKQSEFIGDIEQAIKDNWAYVITSSDSPSMHQFVHEIWDLAVKQKAATSRKPFIAKTMGLFPVPIVCGVLIKPGPILPQPGARDLVAPKPLF